MYSYNPHSILCKWSAKLALYFGFLLLANVAVAQAQTAKNATSDALAKIVINSPAPSISGNTFDKKPFQLSSLIGKVVVVMFWSTDCAVCRDQMPELRENIRGWADKPFELVLVNVDKNIRDVETYNDIISRSVPVKQRFIQLWAGDASYRDNVNLNQTPKNQLPLTLVLDQSGKVVAKHSGRIPAAWWDTIADLL